MRSHMLRTLLFSVVMLFASSASADQAGTTAKVITLRPYANGAVYVFISGGYCGTSVFSISDVSTASGKAMYAAALSAYLSGVAVLIETTTNGVCSATSGGSWGMPLQSLYLCDNSNYGSTNCWN